jgi:hypothetical protein
MTRADDVETFRNLLTAATQLVDAEYFLLPVADQNGGEPIIQYRERVYSYELYHQLRVKWPHWDYSLGGEVDKRKHPVIHGQGLGQREARSIDPCARHDAPQPCRR